MTSNCLQIVDVQVGFINESTKHIPARVQSLQDAYEVVFATRFFNAEKSLYRSLMHWYRFAKDADDFALAFDLRSHVTIVDKDIYTCASAEFLDTLQRQGVSKVDVCGIDTDICVTKCAVDLFENGIEPRVLQEYRTSCAGTLTHEATLVRGRLALWDPVGLTREDPDAEGDARFVTVGAHTHGRIVAVVYT